MEYVKKSVDGVLHKESNKYWIVASTADMDRDGEVILPTAFKNLDAYLKTNPVVLFAHNRHLPPIGKAVNGRITDNALGLEIVFADTELGREVKYLYENGFMNAFSVGFIPKAHEIKTADNGSSYVVFTDVELLEVSAVPVPANAAAVMIREARQKGVNLSAMAALYSDAGASAGPSGQRQKLTAAERVKLFARTVK